MCVPGSVNLLCEEHKRRASYGSSFLYQGVYATGITYHLKLSNGPLKTLLNIKLSVFHIVVYLCTKPVYMYVLKGALFRIWCGVNRLGDSGVKVM